MRYACSRNFLLPCVEAFTYLWTPPLSSRADGPLFQVNRLAFLGEDPRSMCRVVFIVSGSLESHDETLSPEIVFETRTFRRFEITKRLIGFTFDLEFFEEFVARAHIRYFISRICRQLFHKMKTIWYLGGSVYGVTGNLQWLQKIAL